MWGAGTRTSMAQGLVGSSKAGSHSMEHISLALGMTPCPVIPPQNPLESLPGKGKGTGTGDGSRKASVTHASSPFPWRKKAGDGTSRPGLVLALEVRNLCAMKLALSHKIRTCCMNYTRDGRVGLTILFDTVL